MSLIVRQLGEKIVALADKMPIISITGPRQSGKTTLARQIFPNYTYMNLENPLTRSFASENPQRFLAQSESGLIIDEAQYLPELFSWIMLHVDETRRNGEIVLSGSQNFLLMEKITQSLAGRVAIFHLLPFSVSEFAGTEHICSNPYEYIFKGFFPRIYDQDIPPALFYPSYIQTYIERDLRQLQSIGDLDMFERFLRLCAGRIGQIFNQAALSNELGVSPPTIQRWMLLLQTSFVAFKLQPYYKNFNKRILKSPKLYFYDTGLACALLGINKLEDIETHFAKGALFENFIILEYLKRYYNTGRTPSLYYWRDHTGHEVDLIVAHGAKLYPIEIKSGERIHETHFQGLQYFQSLSGVAPEDAYLVYGGDLRQDRNTGKLRSWADLPEFE